MALIIEDWKKWLKNMKSIRRLVSVLFLYFWSLYDYYVNFSIMLRLSETWQDEDGFWPFKILPRSCLPCLFEADNTQNNSVIDTHLLSKNNIDVLQCAVRNLKVAIILGLSFCFEVSGWSLEWPLSLKSTFCSLVIIQTRMFKSELKDVVRKFFCSLRLRLWAQWSTLTFFPPQWVKNRKA